MNLKMIFPLLAGCRGLGDRLDFGDEGILSPLLEPWPSSSSAGQ